MPLKRPSAKHYVSYTEQYDLIQKKLHHCGQGFQLREALDFHTRMVDWQVNVSDGSSTLTDQALQEPLSSLFLDITTSESLPCSSSTLGMSWPSVLCTQKGALSHRYPPFSSPCSWEKAPEPRSHLEEAKVRSRATYWDTILCCCLTRSLSKQIVWFLLEHSSREGGCCESGGWLAASRISCNQIIK